MDEQKAVIDFTTILLTLTFNSKDIINALTLHAHTQISHARALTNALALHLGACRQQGRFVAGINRVDYRRCTLLIPY
jgi:hypothetical protein